MGGEELLRSVARFQKEMLRKREVVKLMADEPKSKDEKGKSSSWTWIVMCLCII